MYLNALHDFPNGELLGALPIEQRIGIILGVEDMVD